MTDKKFGNEGKPTKKKGIEAANFYVSLVKIPVPVPC
jgi:hypothetical protein